MRKFLHTTVSLFQLKKKIMFHSLPVCLKVGNFVSELSTKVPLETFWT
jgi:hypothetical protein